MKSKIFLFLLFAFFLSGCLGRQKVINEYITSYSEDGVEFFNASYDGTNVIVDLSFFKEDRYLYHVETFVDGNSLLVFVYPNVSRVDPYDVYWKRIHLIVYNVSAEKVKVYFSSSEKEAKLHIGNHTVTLDVSTVYGNECQKDNDCIHAFSCCHRGAGPCVPAGTVSPMDCSGIVCTTECRPCTMCRCISGRCVAIPVGGCC